MSNPVRRGAAAIAIAVAGLLHLVIAQEYLKEKFYIGLLFSIAVPLTLGVAWAMLRSNARGAWAFGSLLCVGMIGGFLISRTIGLPGFDESGSWTTFKEGIPSLVVETAFLIIAVLEVRSIKHGGNLVADAPRVLENAA